MMTPRKIILTASACSAIGLATPMIAKWEGLETRPYQDIGGVMTVCYGETHIEMRNYTKRECLDMLKKRVPDYYTSAMRWVETNPPVSFQAAITSFTYNVGEGAFKRSILLKKTNKGDFKGACKELNRWSYVGRMWVRGLANRRADEKKLCLQDL